jgi:hypothetical protein
MLVAEYSSEGKAMADIGNQIIKTGYETYITLAGGRIRCLRCTARSVRSGMQCAKPAMKSSRTQKCSHHGGWATGPKTAAGRQRIAQAHTIHGESTKAARHEHSKASARLSMLEDCMYLLGMTAEPRIRGRKPVGYIPIRTFNDVKQVLRWLTP